MKVICIDATPRIYPTCNLKEGERYTVQRESSCRHGYILKEIKSPHNYEGSYWKDRFIPLSEIDEMQLINELSKTI